MSCGGACTCRAKTANDPGRPIVSVNGRVIPLADIEHEMQHHPASALADAWAQASRALVLRDLLLERARTRGLVATPDVDAFGRTETEDEALLRSVIEADVRVPVADDDVCRRYYQKNLSRFHAPDIFEVSHILLAADRRDPVTYHSAGDRAAALQSAIMQNNIDFEDAARRHSDCPSRNTGGSLGQITIGDTTPEFEAAFLSLEPGAMTAAPVASRYGFHIVRLDRRISGAVVPFEAVQTGIADYLDKCVRRRAMVQYTQVLLISADVQGIDVPIANGPLVQ
jgi:peptidyl-prolyl cis-trans isomerase C